MSEKFFNGISENEVSLKDIIDFLTESWKIIIVTGFFGLVGSITYMWVTPSQYRAIAQIQVAQISTSISNYSGVNVEDPNLLISRLKLPSSYSAQDIKVCGIKTSASSFETLAKLVETSLVKGVNSIIELKINAGSKAIAIACAQAIFENIKASQMQMVKPSIEEAKMLLEKYQSRLEGLQGLISKVDKSGAALSVAYLSNRDELRYLADEILRLNSFIMNSEIRQTRLVAPIYAADAPILPNKKFNLIIGLIIGLLLGLLFVLAKKYLARLKENY